MFFEWENVVFLHPDAKSKFVILKINNYYE